MSRENLQESVSALMDNETDPLELRRVLAHMDSDEQLRAQWMRYQVARAAMHRELYQPRLDLASAVSRAIAEESAVPPARRLQHAWRSIGRVAVAASVCVAVLAGVRLYNSNTPALNTSLAQTDNVQFSLPQTQAPVVLASYNEDSPAPENASTLTWQQHRLPSYLRQHAQQAAYISNGTVLPYARAASLESQ
jgi:sigma-E factor negative regulatory protein RseA